jgi:pseudaminic acid cytidylyltransferase
MIIAIIPARGGSKRIKKKNIKLFCSKPMISWTIDSLKKSNFFDKIVVTSDDNKILRISKEYGADILIKRNKNLSDDLTGTKPVIQDAIKKLIKNHSLNPKYICCIYPCNPFLDINNLSKGLRILKKNKNFQIFSITKYSHPIQRALIIKNKKIYFINKNNSLVRTQDLKETFYDAGQFYWAHYKLWMSDFSTDGNSKGIIIPTWKSHDIDNKDDWKRAEIFFKNLNNK